MEKKITESTLERTKKSIEKLTRKSFHDYIKRFFKLVSYGEKLRE
jgi:hypothetical protein